MLKKGTARQRRASRHHPDALLQTQISASSTPDGYGTSGDLVYTGDCWATGVGWACANIPLNSPHRDGLNSLAFDLRSDGDGD